MGRGLGDRAKGRKRQATAIASLVLSTQWLGHVEAASPSFS